MSLKYNIRKLKYIYVVIFHIDFVFIEILTLFIVGNATTSSASIQQTRLSKYHISRIPRARSIIKEEIRRQKTERGVLFVYLFIKNKAYKGKDDD